MTSNNLNQRSTQCSPGGNSQPNQESNARNSRSEGRTNVSIPQNSSLPHGLTEESLAALTLEETNNRSGVLPPAPESADLSLGHVGSAGRHLDQEQEHGRSVRVCAHPRMGMSSLEAQPEPRTARAVTDDVAMVDDIANNNTAEEEEEKGSVNVSNSDSEQQQVQSSQAHPQPRLATITRQAPPNVDQHHLNTETTLWTGMPSRT